MLARLAQRRVRAARQGDAVRTVLRAGLRGSRTRAEPGSRKPAPEMTALPSSRSRSTSSRRRASIWACKVRRSSETACSLVVSSFRRDVARLARASVDTGSWSRDSFSCVSCITTSSTGRMTASRVSTQGSVLHFSNDRSRRASSRRRSDFRSGLADSESGNAAIRPAWATKQNGSDALGRVHHARIWANPIPPRRSELGPAGRLLGRQADHALADRGMEAVAAGRHRQTAAVSWSASDAGPWVPSVTSAEESRW